MKLKIKTYENHDVKKNLMVIKSICLISLDLIKSNHKDDEGKDKHDVPKSKKMQKYKDNR